MSKHFDAIAIYALLKLVSRGVFYILAIILPERARSLDVLGTNPALGITRNLFTPQWTSTSQPPDERFGRRYLMGVNSARI